MIKGNKMSRLNVLKGLMITLAIIGFSGCTSTSDIEVEALTSEKVNLAGYKTYEIIEGSGIVDTTQRSDNMDIDAEMKQMINAELAKKGKMVVTKDPDFYVVIPEKPKHLPKIGTLEAIKGYNITQET